MRPGRQACPDRGGRGLVTRPIRPGSGRPGVPPPRPGRSAGLRAVPNHARRTGPSRPVLTAPLPGAAPRRCPQQPIGGRRWVLPAEQRERLDRSTPPRPHQHPARSPGTRERRHRGHRCAGGVRRAGRTAGAGPAAGHRRRSPPPAPPRARRGSGRSRPVTRPGSPGTPRPCRGHRPAPGGDRPPGPGPPLGACSRSGCRPADAPVRRGNTTGPRSRAAPSRRPGSARTRAGRRPGAGSTSAAPSSAVADGDPPVPVGADRAHPHVTRPGHQQLRPPPHDVAVREPQRPTLRLTHPTSPFLLRCAGFCRSSPVPPGAARGDTPSWWGERPVSLLRRARPAPGRVAGRRRTRTSGPAQPASGRGCP